MIDPKLFALLRVHDACQGLSDEEIQTIAAKSEVVHAATDEVIHPSNQKVDDLYLVLLGRLKMTLKAPGGVERTIRYVGAGDQFGALMLVTGDSLPVDVKADEKSVLFKLSGEDAKQFAEQFPMLRRNLLKKLGVAVQDSLLKRRIRRTSKVVGFIHTDETTRDVVSKIATRMAALNEKVGIISDADASAFDPSIHFRSLCDDRGEYLGQSEVRKIFSKWPNYDRIFIVVDGSHPLKHLVRLVELSEVVFCLATTAKSDSTIDALDRLIERSPAWKKKTHFVWVLGSDEQVAPCAPKLARLVERDFKTQCSDQDTVTRLSTQGLDRIVHYLRGVSVGLALSGGGAHGMTHLGVLRAFEEAGITIDIMAGTSAGVLTGVIYSSGYSPQWGIEHFTRDLEPGSIYKMLPRGDSFYMWRKYRAKAWDQMLRKYVFDWRLEQFPVSIHTVTTDLIAARSVVRSSGDAVNALLESINLPVISPPICRDGMLLVDGGILNNLPADVLLKLGCNTIIGVDVAAHIAHQVGKNLPDTPTKDMKSPNSVTTFLRCMNVQANNMSRVGAQSADVTITPDVSRFESTAFTKTPEMAEIGYQATMEALPQIREILNHLDASLFPE